MKKLFLMGLFLLAYWIGMAQDTIVPYGNQRNIPNQSIAAPSAIENQPSVPAAPKAPDQPVSPIQTVPSPTPNTNLNTLPGQVNSPVQPTVPPQVPAPNQFNPSNPASPQVQPTVPVPSGQVQTYPQNVIVQPTVPVQSPVQSNYQPVQQNVPIQSDLSRKPQQGGYYQTTEEALIGGRVVRFTFIASPQVTWMTSGSRQVSDSKSKFGFAYGVEGDIFLASERYSLLTGMVVSSLGGTLGYKIPIKFSGVDLPAGTKVEYFLRYLEIPIALKMRSKDFNNMRFFAQFGLNTWMNIKAKASTSDGSFNKEVVGDEVRFFNVGLNVGGGIEYDLGNRNSVTAGIIYSGSFNDSTNNSTVSDKTTINSLRIRLGFIF